MSRMFIGLLAAGLSCTAAFCASVELTTLDHGTGKPVPARVLVADAQGKQYQAEHAVIVPIGPDLWFVSDGHARVEVPKGRVRVLVERGLEYQTAVEDFETGAAPVKRKIELTRWIDMKARGYASGECHLHVAAAELGPMLAAEDLDFGNSLYWWNGPKLALPPNPSAVMDLQYGGHSAPTSIYDAEVENPWGAVYFAGLRQPVELPWVRPQSNVAFLDFARSNGALIAYQGGWSREVLIDALNGKVDVVNLCNNNFHRFKYQPRRQYSNLLNVSGFPEYPNTAEGMMRMNFETYYRLLNCGLRLAAGAESATGAKTTPVGYNRSYVAAGAHPTLANYYENWRLGRNFVTNGPVILLTAEGGRAPGDTIALPVSGGTVMVKVEVLSGQPLKSVEVVANGEVVGRAEIPAGARHIVLPVAVKARAGLWIAGRATAEDQLLSETEMARFASPGKSKGGETPTRLRFGHTSPIYVTVGGQGARVRNAFEDARKMLAAFEGYARKTALPEYIDEALAQTAAAGRALDQIMKDLK